MSFSVEDDVKELQAKVIILETQVVALSAQISSLKDMVAQKQPIEPARRWLADDAERGLS